MSQPRKRAPFEIDEAAKRANARADIRLQLVAAMMSNQTVYDSPEDMIEQADKMIDALERRRQEERDGEQKGEAAE